jgi:PEP-CTERM motif-containing protein
MTDSFRYTLQLAHTAPEPSCLLLMGTGLIGVIGARRKLLG